MKLRLAGTEDKRLYKKGKGALLKRQNKGFPRAKGIGRKEGKVCQQIYISFTRKETSVV